MRGNMREAILILNADDSYAAMTAVRLRAEHFDCRIIPWDTPYEAILAKEPAGLLITGGISGEIPEGFDERLLHSGIPILALGDAAPLMARALGVGIGPKEEPNLAETVRFLPSKLTEGLTESERKLNGVRELFLSGDLILIARWGNRAIGFRHANLPIYALDFQIENNDPDGMELLVRFARDICGLEPVWDEMSFIAKATEDLRALAEGTDCAVCVLTGGLDSGVNALLAQKALGQRLQCVFVETGLLRENETERTVTFYRDRMGLKILVVDAAERIYQALNGLYDQDLKKQAVTACLNAVLSETLDKLKPGLFIDATTANDVYSGRPARSVLIAPDIPCAEPLRELFKEEIRSLSEFLGMPKEMSTMQSFPGTGLALRVMGVVTRERLRVLRGADYLFAEEIKRMGLNKRLWKYFVMVYHIPYHDDPEAMVLALRAVSASNQEGNIRALPARLPYDLLENYTDQIRQQYHQIKKVVYDLTPGQSYKEIEWH